MERTMLFFLLRKLFPAQVKNDNLEFEDLQKLKQTPSKKRNEEKIKQIWKRYLRKIYDDFKCQQSEKEGFKRSNSCDKWKEFYFNMFKDLIEKKGKQFNFDLIMDICTEKTIGIVNLKKPKQLNKSNNWKTLKKISAMKKIPASFRYLVTQSKEYLENFKEYLNVKNPNGIITLMKEIIQNKLFNLFHQWEISLKKLKNDEEKFITKVENQIKKKKFKLPWLLSNVKNSIDYCIKDIENDKLFKKFKNIQKKHYSMKKRSDETSE